MEYSLTSTRDRRMVPAGSTATASASTATLRSLVHSGSGAAGVNPMNRYLKRSRLPSPPKEEDVVFAPPPSEFDTGLWKFLSNTLPHELVGQIVSFTGTAMPTIHVLYKTQIQQNIAPDGSGYRVRFNSLTPLGNGRVNGKWPRFADAGIEPNRSTPQIGSHRLETPPSSAVTSHATDNEMPTRIYLTSARIPFRMSNMRCVMGVGETRMIADLIGSINLAPRDGSSQFLRFALDSRTEDMYFECMIGDDTIIGISDNALITSTPAGYARIWIAERSVESASPPAIPAGPPFTRFISAGTVSRSVLSDEKMTSSHIIFAGFLPNSPRDMGFIISEDEVDPASLELHEGPRFCIVRSVTSKDGPSVIAVQKVNLRHWNRRVSYGLVLSESGPGARSVSAGSAIVGPGYFLYTVQSDGWYRIMQQSYAEADTALVDRLIYQASGPVSGSGDTYDDTMVFAGSLLKGILTASLPIKQKSGEFVPSSDFMRVVMFEFDAFVTGGQQPQDYNVAKLTESVIGGQPPQDKNVAKFPLAVALHSVYARGIQEPKFYTKTGNKGGNVEWWMLMPDASGLIGIRPSRPQLLVPLNKRNGRLHLESMPKQNEILDVLLRERVYVTFITLVVEDEHRLAAVTYIPGESTARVQVYEFHQPKLALDVRLTKRQLDRMPVDFEFTMKLVPLKTSGPTRIYFESRQMQIAEDDADAKDVTVRICYRILQITGPYIIVDVIRGPKEEAGMKLMYTTLTQHAKTAATAQRWNLSGPQAFTSNKPRKTGFTDPYMIGVVPSTRLYAYMSLMFVNPEDVKRTDGGKVKIRLCLELEDPAKSAEPPYIVLSAPWMVRADTLKTISYESIFLGSRSFIYAIQTEYGLRVVMQSYESSSPSVAVDTLIYSEGRTYDAVVRQDIEGEEGGPANVRQDPALTGSFREGVVHVFRCVYKAMDALRVTTIEL
jgi:hypothetical protein